MAYNIINLKKIYKVYGETRIKEFLGDFQSPLNKDVEYFIKEKAIEFSKQSIAETFIVTSSYKNQEVIVGYFALANKAVLLQSNMFKGEKKKRFSKFAKYNEYTQSYLVSLPLIGQLGKNYYNNYNKLIDGNILLDFAFKKVKEGQDIFGGRFVFLECEDNPKLKEFYENNGFVCFGKRNLERDERENNAGEYLLQMLRDLSNYE